MKFYHYPHCPFCQRVRLALKYKGVEYEDITLSYGDVETPTDLVGAKMLPIIDFGDGTVMAESLDLVAEIEKRFPVPQLFDKNTKDLLAWASRAAVSIPRYFDLLIPAYLDGYTGAPEFDEAGIEYYQTRKEEKRGTTFAALAEQRFDIYQQNVVPRLTEIIEKIDEGFVGKVFSAADCVLASDLSGLRVVEGIELPEAITDYILAVEEVCGDDLLVY